MKPERIAKWMLEKVEQEESVFQRDMVSEIAEQFGEEFTYQNENGNMAIDKQVLNAFRKLSGDKIVWERSNFLWRKREDDDEPSRQQY